MGILSREGADFGGYWRIILSYHFERMRRGTPHLIPSKTQHAASLQLETKLGEKSKLACFGSEVLEFENQIKYYTFA